MARFLFPHQIQLPSSIHLVTFCELACVTLTKPQSSRFCLALLKSQLGVWFLLNKWWARSMLCWKTLESTYIHYLWLVCGKMEYEEHQEKSQPKVRSEMSRLAAAFKVYRLVGWEKKQKSKSLPTMTSVLIYLFIVIHVVLFILLFTLYLTDVAVQHWLSWLSMSHDLVESSHLSVLPPTEV